MILSDVTAAQLAHAFDFPEPPLDGTVVVSGGTGSFGRAFTRYLLENTTARVRVFSRDEHKQADMAREFPAGPRLSYLLGDVRDYDRLCLAFDGAQAIVHAAALKTVPAGERQFSEFVQTNIYGTENVIRAALDGYIPDTLLVSSDKAVAAVNSYGKSKAVAESLFTQANVLCVSRDCRFSVVRGGNVWGSRGSVVENWRAAMRQNYPLEMTDPAVTRFHLAMPDWTAFVLRALREMHGGEIFVPKCRAWRLGDLAAAFGGYTVTTGARDGDKQGEILYSAYESQRTIDAGWAYIVNPPSDLRAVWNYQPVPGAPVEAGREFSSDTAERMGVEELRSLL